MKKVNNFEFFIFNISEVAEEKTKPVPARKGMFERKKNWYYNILFSNCKQKCNTFWEIQSNGF